MENRDSNNNVDLAASILQQAPQMMQKGQFIALKNLISRLPPEQHTAWIQYWSGNATLPVNPLAARIDFEKAFSVFCQQQDLAGIYLSWAGIVDTFMFSWDDFRPLDHWIQWMHDWLQENPVFPSPEVEARLVFGMFCSLMYRQPQHADLPAWSVRLGNMLEHIPDKNSRILMATHYVLYLTWMGQFEKAELVIERLKPSAILEFVQPVYLIAWKQTEAMLYWLMADFKNSRQSLKAGFSVSGQSAIHIWDFILSVQDAYLALELESPEKWQNYNQNILAIMDKNGRLHQAYYHYYAGLESLLLRKQGRALLHINKSLTATKEMGTPYPEALNLIAKCRILIEQHKLVEADFWLNEATRLADILGSDFLRFNLQLTQAELLFARNNNQVALDALTSALSTGNRKQYFSTDWWRPYTMCYLCIQALQHNIEVDYVQKLITTRKLVPDSPQFELENWPWAVRIYTLGRFSVLLGGTVVNTRSKGKNKPVEMLKALVAMGGRDVSEGQINEALWPDSDGDQAHSAFTTTLSRCRKLIGRELLPFHNGRLSLNDHLCWVDSWAFERSLGELESMLSQNSLPHKQEIQNRVDILFNLYQGMFLEKEPQMGWMLPYRERLSIKFQRLLKQLIQVYGQAGGNCGKVITLYEKARELEPMSEQYCRGLMRCHAAQGNRAEALVIYNRCHTMLTKGLGIKPSEKTTALYRIIKTGKQDQLQKFCEHCSPLTE